MSWQEHIFGNRRIPAPEEYWTECDRCGTPSEEITMTDTFCRECLDNVPLCRSCTLFHIGEILADQA